MLRAFGHSVAACCVMLGVVGLNLKMVKLQHLWMLHDVVVVWPGSCNNFAPGRAHYKRGQHVATTMVRSFGQSLQILGQQCWVMLC